MRLAHGTMPGLLLEDWKSDGGRRRPLLPPPLGSWKRKLGHPLGQSKTPKLINYVIRRYVCTQLAEATEKR
jgi:hypothetical protein